MYEWEEESKRNLWPVVVSELQKNTNLTVTALDGRTLSSEKKLILEDTALLFDSVSASIIFNTYWHAGGRHIFSAKLETFDYSLGQEVRALATEVDAYLLIRGIQSQRSGGLIARQIFGSLLYIPILDSERPKSEFNIALVDGQDGTILWFYLMSGSYNLQHPVGVDTFMRELSEVFPLR